MIRKALTTKWKVIISCILIIVAMAGSGAMAWAIAKHYFKQDYNYEITAIGNRHVNANIKSYSYLAGSSDPYETLATKTFNGTTTETTALSFARPLTIENDELVSKFRFEIENTSPYSTQTDLIIKVNTETQDKDDMILTWYYSIDDEDYYVYTGEYLVGHKGNTTILELRVLATADLEGTTTISDKISIELFSEIEPPADFEYEYNYYYDSDTNTATKIKKCATCENCTHEYVIENILANDMMVITDGVTFLYDDPIYNKYIFLDVAGVNQTISFNGLLNNVVIIGYTTLLGGKIVVNGLSSNITFTHIIFEDVEEGNVLDMKGVSNAKIIDCSFRNCTSLGDWSSINGLLIKDCEFSYSGYVNYTFEYIDNFKFINNDLNNDSLVRFMLSSVNNILLSFCDMVQLPAITNCFGDIYFINNSSESYALNFISVKDANVVVKNSLYTNASDSGYVLIQSVINSIIEISDNNYYMGEYRYEISNHKVSSQENITTPIFFGRWF